MAAERSFLGTGWSFPPTFTQGGAVLETVANEDDIHQSLEILLATHVGERVMHETFGCNLTSALFEEMDQGLVNTLTGMIADAILYHEPRITLDLLEVSEDQAIAGRLLISLAYTVRNTNSRFNMVYPFYLNEATTPGAS